MDYLHCHTILLLVFRYHPESFCRICSRCAAGDVWSWCILTWWPPPRPLKCLFPGRCLRTSQIQFSVRGDIDSRLSTPFFTNSCEKREALVNSVATSEFQSTETMALVSLQQISSDYKKFSWIILFFLKNFSLTQPRHKVKLRQSRRFGDSGAFSWQNTQLGSQGNSVTTLSEPLNCNKLTNLVIEKIEWFECVFVFLRVSK